MGICVRAWEYFFGATTLEGTCCSLSPQICDEELSVCFSLIIIKSSLFKSILPLFNSENEFLQGFSGGFMCVCADAL
jgi:hypothetical protein